VSTAENLSGIKAKVTAQNAEEQLVETTMHTNFEPQDTAGFSFQVDLLNLNLNLAEKEQTLQPQARAHEAALVQIRSLADRH
jgi:hypothetical protein